MVSKWYHNRKMIYQSPPSGLLIVYSSAFIRQIEEFILECKLIHIR